MITDYPICLDNRIFSLVIKAIGTNSIYLDNQTFFSVIEVHSLFGYQGNCKCLDNQMFCLVIKANKFVSITKRKNCSVIKALLYTIKLIIIDASIFRMSFYEILIQDTYNKLNFN